MPVAPHPPAGAQPPGPNAAVLPPLNAPWNGQTRNLPPIVPPRSQTAGGEGQMTLVSPAGSQRGDGTDWAVVLGIILVAEIGLLWAAACVGLWRRRIAFERALQEALEVGRHVD
ncbi:hypothetical protein [Actinomadura roseirufa]|uniref:hypothetical protein n=1 Tax=Actinomadura roseirufa TaxID=2094049 RepID=UPI00104120BE|nr:hypothetical protein [Actinomadura roseirufa]